MTAGRMVEVTDPLLKWRVGVSKVDVLAALAALANEDDEE